MTPEQFGKAIVAAGLLTADDVKAVWNALPANGRPKDGEGFAKLLVRPGMITEFQAEQLLAGQGTSLVLGDYVILSKIGAGGMGQVFKARHRRMKRVVAIKLLPAAVVKDAAAIKRFEREVEAAARLTHPNIVAALDARAEKGVHYLVMECVEGQDLSALVKQRGPLPVDEAVDYIRQAACGLAYAHSEGVVHRDIKPANLLLDKKGVVKILDMGLARFDESGDAADHQLTNTGQVMGTVDYMAPEQAQDTHAADARSDIYSLGCSLYRLLVGESVFHAETVVKKILAHMNAPIPSLVAKRPDVPAELDRVFQRMMAKQPEDRYQSMDDVVAALSPFAPGAVSSTSVTSPGGATDTNLTNFLQSLGGPPSTGSKSQVLPSKTKAAPEQTMARVSAEVGTDPKSEVLAKAESGKRKAVATAAASPVASARGVRQNAKNPPLLWIAGGGGGILTLLLGVIVIIYNSDGQEVARVQIPEGGSATVQTVSTVPALTGSPSRPKAISNAVPRTPLPDGPPGEALQIPLTNRAAFVAAARDGRHIAIYDAIAYKVLWYELAAGKLVWERKFTDTPGGVGLAISHDGQTLALCGYRTATKTGVIHLLRTADGGVAQTLTAAEYFRSIAFSPDDKLLAVGTDAGSVKLFDLAGGAPPRLLTGLTTRIDAVAFSPSGDKLAAGAGYKVGIAATTAVWNAVTGVRDVWSASDNIGIASLEYSRDGKAILAGTGNASASLYDAATGNQLGVVKDPRRQSLRNARLLPSARHALCAGGRLLLCELPSCQIIQEFGEPTAEVIIDLDVTPDGRFAVSLLANEPILRVWRLPKEAWASNEEAGSSGMSPLANLLLSSDYVWSEPENLGPTINGPNNDYVISLTNDERRLFFHGNDAAGTHRFAEAVRGSLAEPFGKPQTVPSISTDAYIAGDGLTVVAIIRGESSTHDVMIQRRPTLGAAWDKGVNLGPQVNSTDNERLPTLSPDGLALLFVSNRNSRGVNDLWISRRKSPVEPFGPATNVGPPVNSSSAPVGGGVMLGDGQTILFIRGAKLSIAFTGPNGGRAALELEDHPFSTDSSGLSVWFAPDGRTAYFTADRPGGHGGKDVWVTRRIPKGSARSSPVAPPATPLALAELPAVSLAEFITSPDYVWSEPENLGTPVNSTLGESFPAISGDGLVLVFAAARTGGEGSSDLYIAQRKRIDEPFAKPVNMGPTINTPSPDQNPWLSTDGCTLLYSTNRDGDAGNLYYATRASQDAPFSPARPIEGEVNTSSGESGGALSGDGRILIYASTNRGNEDLWQATRDDPRGPFGNRVRLGNEVNSPLFERHPWLSTDGRLLVFSTVPENTNDEKLKATDTKPRIWMASRPDTTARFEARKLLTVPVPFGGREQHASLTTDGHLLFYSSQRTADASDHDIWLTRRVPKGMTGPSPPAPNNSINTALKFDGDDLVEIPSLTFDPQGSYTLEGFITSPASAEKGAGLAFGMPQQSYLSFTRLGDWRWVYSPKTRDHGMDIALAGAPARQARTHVACVRNGQSHRLYVDGKLFSKTAEIPSPAIGTSPFQIGSEFRGIMDELRVSKVARYTADFTPAARFEPDADTLGLYHFDEAAGDVLKDSSGHNHHGKITGATWVKLDGTTVSQLGKAVADYALDPAANPDRANPISIELPRFLKASDPMTVEMFVTPRTPSPATISRSLWSLAGVLELKQYANRIVWQRNNRDSKPKIEQTSFTLSQFGTKMHLAAVSTGTELRLYADGKLSESIKLVNPLPSNSGLPIILASSESATGGYQPFDGTIDDVRISTVARYDADFTPPASHERDADTAALYRCNEGDGEVLVDASGHKRDGKVIGVRWSRDGRAPPTNPQSAIPSSPLPVGEGSGVRGQPRTFAGHENVVREVAVTPDGKCAVSVAWDNTWRRWDLETGTQMNKVPAHPSLTNCLVISPDGKLLVTGASDNHVKLWDLATGIEKRSYYVPKAGHFSTLAFTPDGQQFLSASSDGKTRLWGLEDSNVVREFSGTGSDVWDIAFLPGSEQFVTVGSDKQVRFWNLKTGRQVTNLPEHPTGVAAAVFSPKGRWLTTASNGLIQFWIPTTRTLEWEWKFNNTSAGTLAYLPGGRYLVAGLQDKSIRIYDTTDRKEVHKFLAPNAVTQHLAVTPDGRQIVSGGGYQVIDKLRSDDDFRLYVWDVPPQFVSGK